jgi:ribonucleoside-diphosphate reductase alpha chain
MSQSERVMAHPKLKLVRQVQVDRSRDALLTDFGRSTLDDRYLAPGESYQDAFARVATAFADDAEHAQRMYDYISKLWFMPSTPVLSNGGLDRGLPISCFLNAVPDTIDGIREVWNENIALATNGGGIGTYWGSVRSIGEKVKGAGQTSGIIPFIRVMDSLTLAISQGSLRRGSAAVYVDIHHPEIEEFLEIRKPSGDFNRKSLNLHHGINITDAFMEAVRAGAEFDLLSPKTKQPVKTVDARTLWQKILDIRIQTGEPYLIFSDTVNRGMPEFQRELGHSVRQSNLCAEIMLHTGKDYRNNERTAVCCLSSVNAEYYMEWKDDPRFLEDAMRFLDNILQDFINRAETYDPRFKNAIYAAANERSVGLGLMGFHSFLQKMGVPFESAMAKSWNLRMFKHIRKGADAASELLAIERGPCPDWVAAHLKERSQILVNKLTEAECKFTTPQRFSHKLAIAPTASISIICGGASAGIEPIPANIYTHKTLSGSFTVKNPYLDAIIRRFAAENQHTETHEELEAWCEAQWELILLNGGSVSELEWMSDDEKAVFKTAFEIDQRWVIELAADRTPEVCQSQSVNIFLPGNVNKYDLHMLHWMAWERGVKSLYYLRSQSVQRAAHAGEDDVDDLVEPEIMTFQPRDYDQCLACQ